ncbi:MAG: prepilin peptidase [Bacteroidales bacterium]|nr:prepilin peptidase [Bacteroidales bacterium]
MLIINIILFIFVGWLSGLLVNYIVEYFPYSRKLEKPYCNNCQASLSLIESSGFRKCQACGQKKNLRFWIVQVAYSSAFLLLWFYPPEKMGAWLAAAVLVYFGIVALIDIDHKAILNEISMVGGVIGIIVGILLHGLKITILGGVGGFLCMLLLYYLGGLFLKIYNKIRKLEIDEIPLGFGDVNLSGIAGLMLGWPGVIGGLFLAVFIAGFFSGGLLIVSVIRKKYQPSMAIPYAPFIILGTLFLLLRA